MNTLFRTNVQCQKNYIKVRVIVRVRKYTSKNYKSLQRCGFFSFLSSGRSPVRMKNTFTEVGKTSGTIIIRVVFSKISLNYLRIVTLRSLIHARKKWILLERIIHSVSRSRSCRFIIRRRCGNRTFWHAVDSEFFLTACNFLAQRRERANDKSSTMGDPLLLQFANPPNSRRRGAESQRLSRGHRGYREKWDVDHVDGADFYGQRESHANQ